MTAKTAAELREHVRGQVITSDDEGYEEEVSAAREAVSED